VDSVYVPKLYESELYSGLGSPQTGSVELTESTR
jgi:hypothetical protein